MRKRDEPAYPVTLPVSQTGAGLTKLEYTAIQAMQGLLARIPCSSPVMPEHIHAASQDAIFAASLLWDEIEKEK